MSFLRGIFASFFFKLCGVSKGAYSAPFGSNLENRKLFLPLFHHFAKVSEEIVRIVRPGTCLRVILNAEHRIRLVLQTRQCLVVQVSVCLLNVLRKRVRIDIEVVILSRNLDLACLVIHDRVIAAMVAELQLVGLAAQRQPKDLVAETDSE